MKDLAFKQSDSDVMYPTSVGKGKKQPKRYPHLTLPISVLDKKSVDIGDEVTMVIKGKVSRLEKSKYAEEFSIDLSSGELKGDKK